MPSKARQKKIMEKLNRAQKCSILGPQNLGSRGGPAGPPGSAPVYGPNFHDFMRCFGNLAKYSIIHHRESWIRPYIGDNMSLIYDVAKFSQKLLDIGRISTGGGRPKFYYVDPPLIILRTFPDQIYNSFPVIYFGAGLMLALADLRGGARDAPPRVQILSISCSFWENLAKLYVGAPTSAKSWIRHWLGQRNVIQHK